MPSRLYRTTRAVFLSLLILLCFIWLRPDSKSKSAYTFQPVEVRSYQVVKLQNLYVLEDEEDKFTYTLQAIDDSNFATLHIKKGQTIHGTFCGDYEPMFSSGQTLDYLQYEDRHECWELFNQHPKYFIRRNEEHHAVYERKETARADTSPYTPARARQ